MKTRERDCVYRSCGFCIRMGERMGKRLSEMSLEELWELFPIYLTAHQDYWPEWDDCGLRLARVLNGGKQEHDI